MNKQNVACDYIQSSYLDFGRLRYDMIAQKVQILDAELHEPAETKPHEPGAIDPVSEKCEWRYLTNNDINTIVCNCCRETERPVSAREILTVLNSDRVPRVHPLRDYVNSQQPYDMLHEPDWIGDLAAQVHVVSHPQDADDESLQHFWRECFKKWFVAMVGSWLYDGVVNHQVLVLIGRQGIYKTTWLEHLMPPELRSYCCKMSNTSQMSKDDRLRIAEFGLINLDELDAMGTRELNTMKSLITTADVNERVAYGYTKERRKRIASFCASSNRREFLSDMTGNRRWLPFEVDRIASPFTHPMPYERLYAQAKALVECGFYSYWFDLDDIAAIEAHNDDYRIQESEEQLLPILFGVPAKGKGEFLTTAQISERLVTYGNIKKPMALSHLGMLLGRAGYMAVTRGPRNCRTRGWIVYQLTQDEINANKRLIAKSLAESEEVPEAASEANDGVTCNSQEKELFEKEELL